MELWDKRDDESEYEYKYFNLYLVWIDLNIKSFYKDLLLQDYEDVPTLNTLYKWSSIHEWTKRKKAYIINKSLDQRYRLEELNYSKKEEIFKAKHNLIINAINKCANDFNDGKMTGSQFNAWVNGINGLLNDNRLDVLEPTEIRDTNLIADIDAEVSSDISIFDKLSKVDEELKKIDNEEDNVEDDIFIEE